MAEEENLEQELQTVEASTNLDFIERYLIFENGEFIASVSAETLFYALENLENNKTYSYQIQAVSNQGVLGEMSDPIELTPVYEYPNKAYDLKAEIVDETTIKFNWSHDAKENFSHFEVFVNDNAVLMNTLAKEYTYLGAKANFDYKLQVVTVDSQGDRTYSGEITSRIDIATAPKDLKVIPKDREAILSWELNTEPFVVKYNIYLNGVLHAEVNSPNKNLKISDLTNEVEYYFQLQAVGKNGFTSELSEPVYATPKLDIPNKPKIIMHKELGNNGVELVWEHEQKEGHSHYNVYKDGYLYRKDVKEKSFQTDYLESNKTHIFTVEAFDWQGDRSGFSDTHNVILYAKIIEPKDVRLGEIDRDVKVITPQLYLCKPNKTTIAKLNDAYEINLVTRYADLNELTFKIPYQIEKRNELIKNPHFENLQERFLIRLELGEKTEFFIVNEIGTSSDNNSKNVHCWSLGYELQDKKVVNRREEIVTCHSAFLMALENVLNWKIGSNIKNPDFFWNLERRVFDVKSKTVLDFVREIAESFNAVIIWDTVNRVIDLENPLFPAENKGLKIKYGKYLKSISKTTKTDEMVTHLIPLGENGLQINEANPTGLSFLEDFSFFMDGFTRSFDEYAKFYLDSKAVVVDATDPFYVEQGFTTVPRGAVFKNINLATLSLTDRIDTNSVAYGIINAVNIYRKTGKTVWLDQAKIMAEFLVDRQKTGDFYTSRFQFVPNVVDYDTTTGTWISQFSEVDLRTQYLCATALMLLNNSSPNTLYSDLFEGILSLCSMAQNQIRKRVTDNEIPDYMIGSIYRTLNYIQDTADGTPQFAFSWNEFSVSTIDVLAMTWRIYIEYFGNILKYDAGVTSYYPQELINDCATFIFNEYNKGSLTMPNVLLPYGFYFYSYNDLPNAEGEMIPYPANYDWINGGFGDTWFATDLTLWTLNGIALLSHYHTNEFDLLSANNEDISLYEIAYRYRTELFAHKDETYYPNEIVFFDRYSFDGTSGVGTDTSKAITNTALFLTLQNKLGVKEHFKTLKDTLFKYQIESDNPLINGGFQWSLNEGLIENKTLGEIVEALVETNTSIPLTHSKYMSDSLCMAILDYQEKIESYDGEFTTLYQDKRTLQDERNEIQFEYDELETELFVIQDLLDVMKSDGTLWHDEINFSGLPRTLTYELDKDYKYFLTYKTDVVGDITITTNNGTYSLSEANTWLSLEKIGYDATGETLEQQLVADYTYKVEVTGTTNANIQFEIVRILEEEYTTANNEVELLTKYNEERKQNEVDVKKIELDNKDSEIKVKTEEMEVISNELSVYNNFTSEQREERDLFIISKDYIDEKIANPHELMDRAKEKMKELTKPQFTIEIDIINFLEVLEEHRNWDKLQLGTTVNIYYDKFDISVQAKIIEMTFDYSNKTVNLTISNVKENKTNQEKFITALYGAISTSTTVTLEKHGWHKGLEAKEEFDSFVSKEFDATKQKIIAGTNESVEISRRGLLIKSKDDSQNFLVANSSVLAITNDGGKSYKNAITTDGVIGQRLIGEIIAGENLIIENSAGTFKVDGDGVTISNQALKILGGITQEQLSEDVEFKTDLSGLQSTYNDWSTDNNTNGTAITLPTFAIDGTAIQYSNTTAGLVNLSLTWLYDDTGSLETDIDGFLIYLYTSTSSAEYVFGTNESKEITLNVNPLKRSIILYNVPQDLFYNFGVEAYRVVNKEIDPSGVITTTVVTPTNPFNPINNTAYVGDIMGTVDYGNEVRVKTEVVVAIKEGLPYDNVTIDSNNGLVVENNSALVKTILNSDGFRIQTRALTTDPYTDSLRATTNGELVAEDLIANRLIVNDGTGKVLIDAGKSQINFANFDVVTGNIYAQNIDLKGLQVLTDTGEATFTIDNAGNVSVSGNINMKSGSITWETITKPTYTATEVGAYNKTETEAKVSEGVASIQIGGENLNPHTDFEDVTKWQTYANRGTVTGYDAVDGSKGVIVGTPTDSTLIGIHVVDLAKRISVQAGREYTFSAIVVAEGFDVFDYTYILYDNFANVRLPTFSFNDFEVYDERDGSKKIVVTFIPQYTDTIRILLGGRMDIIDKLYVRKWKVEEGNKATTWKRTEEEIQLRAEEYTKGYAKPNEWLPTYDEVTGTEGVDKPTKTANNTFDTLRFDPKILGFQYDTATSELFLNASAIKTGTLDVDKGISISSTTGGVTIDSTGVNVKNGTFTIQEDSGVKFDLRRFTNLFTDHSFELMPTIIGSNAWTTSDPQYHGYRYVDWSMLEHKDAIYWQWGGTGEPVILTNRYTDVGSMAIIGYQTAVVNNLNFFKQAVETMEAGGDYTFSAYVRASEMGTGTSKPSISIYYRNHTDIEWDNPPVFWKTLTWTNLSLDGVSSKRISTTFNIENTHAEILIEIKSNGDGWIEYDGVQLVNHNKPVLYESEQGTFNMRLGIDKYSSILDGKYASFNRLGVGSIENEDYYLASLQNGWVNYSGTSGYQRASYWKDTNGVVHIAGLIKGGTTTAGTVLFNLPYGYRPLNQHIFTCYTSTSGSLARVDVQSSGNVVANTNMNSSWTSLAGITFKAEQ